MPATVIIAIVHRDVSYGELRYTFPVQVCSVTGTELTSFFLQSNVASKPKDNNLLVPPCPFHSFPFPGCGNSYLSKLTHSLPAHGAGLLWLPEGPVPGKSEPAGGLQGACRNLPRPRVGVEEVC